MVALRWSREAATSLREIYQYIARDRPGTAERTIESIVNRVQSLSEYPEVGQRYSYQPRRAVWQLNYGHFRIAYLIDDAGDVTILGVFHGLIFLPLS